MAGDEMQRAVDRVLACPVGCAFLVAVERAGIGAAEAAGAPAAFDLAATAVRALNPWAATGHDEAVRVALERGGRLEELARELLSEPGAAWWSEPIDRGGQVWVGEDAFPAAGKAGVTGSDPRWEGYAERLVGWRVTSTIRDGVSSLEAVVTHRVGDWNFGRVRRGVVEPIGSEARVFEVNGAADWHELCAAHPAVNGDGASPAGEGVLVPDWVSVARGWDGVHVTLLGLLTTPFVRVTSEAGTSMMWSWGAEQTIWLRDEPVQGLVEASRLMR